MHDVDANPNERCKPNRGDEGQDREQSAARCEHNLAADGIAREHEEDREQDRDRICRATSNTMFEPKQMRDCSSPIFNQKARGAARRECNDAQQTIDSGTDSSVTSDSIRPKVPIAPESSANAV